VKAGYGSLDGGEEHVHGRPGMVTRLEIQADISRPGGAKPNAKVIEGLHSDVKRLAAASPETAKSDHAQILLARVDGVARASG